MPGDSTRFGVVNRWATTTANTRYSIRQGRARRGHARHAAPSCALNRNSVRESETRRKVTWLAA
jgi:hypothetical protein